LHHHIEGSEIEGAVPITDTIHKAKYNNQKVIVKYFKPFIIGFEWDSLRRELAIACLCSHPHVIPVLGANLPDQSVIDIQGAWIDIQLK